MRKFGKAPWEPESQNEGGRQRSGPHPSYDYNLMKAKEFLNRTQGKLPEGMHVRLADTDGLRQSVLMFSCTHSERGLWANAVSLHQDGTEFKNELWAAAKVYHDLARDEVEIQKRNAAMSSLQGISRVSGGEWWGYSSPGRRSSLKRFKRGFGGFVYRKLN